MCGREDVFLFSIGANHGANQAGQLKTIERNNLNELRFFWQKIKTENDWILLKKVLIKLK